MTKREKQLTKQIIVSAIIIALTAIILVGWVRSDTVSANAQLTQEDYEDICNQYYMCPEVAEAVVEVEGIQNPTVEDINKICVSLMSNAEDGGDLYDPLTEYNTEEGFADAVLERSYELEREHNK